MWQIFLSGGPVMYPLLLCSVLVMTITIERLWYFLSQRGDLEEIRRIVFRLMEKDAPLEAIQYLQKLNQPVARMYQAALLYYGKDRAQIETSLRDSGELEIKKMERGLGLLDVIITAAPLLGLLGTVTGIIDSFNVLSAAQGLPSAADLSRGIAEALITTAFGLIIAIPSLFLMHWFNRMIDKNLTNMNQMSKEFLENYGNRGEQL
ncbi:MAG: MotA/TolQ/ExbB proton channel family protein [Firmicutes bacterium]|nr:MotA/TolQ/ExbB proton channel family protein [Bacillota bacterium]